MNQTINAAEIFPYKEYEGPKGVPEVVHLYYDAWVLRMGLQFNDWDGIVYVDFEAPRGFRVLDEGDLLEMWANRSETDEWLNVVDSNGWADQEASRAGFVLPASTQTEFLVVGVNDCVSVLANKEPAITIIENNKELQNYPTTFRTSE